MVVARVDRLVARSAACAEREHRGKRDGGDHSDARIHASTPVAPGRRTGMRLSGPWVSVRNGSIAAIERGIAAHVEARPPRPTPRRCGPREQLEERREGRADLHAHRRRRPALHPQVAYARRSGSTRASRSGPSASTTNARPPSPKASTAGTGTRGHVGERERDHLVGHQPAAQRRRPRHRRGRRPAAPPNAGRGRRSLTSRGVARHSAINAPTASPNPRPSSAATSARASTCGPIVGQLRLPEVREVAEPAHEPDHRARPTAAPYTRLDPPAAQPPDRDRGRDPHDHRHEVVAEELHGLGQLRSGPRHLRGDRVRQVDADDHHHGGDRGRGAAPERHRASDREEGEQPERATASRSARAPNRGCR